MLRRFESRGGDISREIDRRSFLRRAGGLVAASALAAACDTSPAPRAAPGWRFAESFGGAGEGWPGPWVNVRYLTRLSRERGTGKIELDPPPGQTFGPKRPHAAYLGAPVVLGHTEALDPTVRAQVRLEGPVEAGVVARVTFDEGYALLVSHDEAVLCRYTPLDRDVLDRAPAPRGAPWTSLSLALRAGEIAGVVAAGDARVELVAQDDDPLPAGMVGVVANQTASHEDGRAHFRELEAGADEPETAPRPEPVYGFTGAVEQDGGRARARLTARGAQPAPVTFEIARDESFSDSIVSGPHEPEGSFGAVRAWIDDLDPGTYYWRAHTRRGDDRLVGPPARFRTPPAPGEAVRFAFASCTSGRTTVYESFDTARRFEPHFYLHAGDWGYADTNSLARKADHFQARWTRLLRAPELSRMLRTTPLMFWQDDHDYEADNGWSETVKRYAVVAFDEIHANPTDEYFDVRWGDVHIWCVDCRRYADDPALPDVETKSRIGERQKRWLMEGMQASDAPVLLVASSMVFRNKVDDDPGWHNAYTAERDQLLAFFAGLDKTVVILSGDAHGQRLIHHFEFGELYEITSSGTDFPPGAGQGDNDPEHTLHHEDRNGFALVDLDPAGPGRALRVRTIDSHDGTTIFEKGFPVGD